MSFENLTKQLDAPEPQKWEPRPGDRIIGTLRRIRYVSGSMSNFAIITIEDQDDLLWDVSCGPASLKRPLTELRVQPGDLVGISFEGMAQTKDGSREFKKFKVATDAQGERIAGTEFDLERAESEGELGFTDSWPTPPSNESDPIETIPY